MKLCSLGSAFYKDPESYLQPEELEEKAGVAIVTGRKVGLIVWYSFYFLLFQLLTSATIVPGAAIHPV